MERAARTEGSSDADDGAEFTGGRRSGIRVLRVRQPADGRSQRQRLGYRDEPVAGRTPGRSCWDITQGQSVANARQVPLP